MNAEQFSQALDAISDADLRALNNGGELFLVDDRRLTASAQQDARALRFEIEAAGDSVQSIRRLLHEQADSIIGRYYLENPLSQPGFNEQVLSLLQTHGAEAFAAGPGQRARCTLFVDGGEVVVEQTGDPRHPYGSFCELGAAQARSGVDDAVSKWVESGQAYEQYLSMNVCRYNC